MNRILRLATVVFTLFGGCLILESGAIAAPQTLPQAHEYQRVLRSYIGSLTEQDFTHGVTALITEQPSSQDPDYLHRNFAFTLMNQPIVGSKRGYPSVNAPGRIFTLGVIESEAAIMEPPVWPETLTSFVQWDYPGNPYYNNRALKLRALVTASVMMIMLDDRLDKDPKLGRSDWYAYNLVLLGVPLRAFKSELPAEARKAYAEGLKKFARRIIAWGPKGEDPNDLIAPIGLWYASQGCDDPEFAKEVEAHARKMLSDPQYFHPAGFWVERGGLDVGYAGIANCFAIGAALAGDWPFAKDTVARAYRLKAHLALPEPDGKWTGPTHFNNRLGTPADNDQWKWVMDPARRFGARDYGAAMVTDEAAWLVDSPTAEDLKTAAGIRADSFRGQLHENPVKSGDGSKANPRVHFTNDEIVGNPWQWRIWQTWDFPISVNFAYEFYPQGYAAHRRELEQQHSPLLKPPVFRDGTFVRDFAQAFYVSKQAGFYAILHTGPIGQQAPDDNKLQHKGPLGLSGGQLSAFWTPATGAVILGRRGGNSRDKAFDLVEAWRTWPNHSVSGVTTAGKFFTSARIRQPLVTSEITGNRATVKASGVIPPSIVNPGEKNLDGTIDYAREFKLDEKGVHVETTVKGDGKDRIGELYEVIPIFHRDGAIQKPEVMSTIEFESGGGWATATANYTEKTTAVRITRFAGAVTITFDRPQRVKLSPVEWNDTYLSGAVCRNVLVDLLESGDRAVALAEAKKIGYRIEPVAK